MVGKSNTKPKELGGIAQEMVKNYNALADDTKLAIKCTNQPEVWSTSFPTVLHVPALAYLFPLKNASMLLLVA